MLSADAMLTAEDVRFLERLFHLTSVAELASAMDRERAKRLTRLFASSPAREVWLAFSTEEITMIAGVIRLLTTEMRDQVSGTFGEWRALLEVRTKLRDAQTMLGRTGAAPAVP